MKKYFVENKEAIFFDDANECAQKCIFYLNNPRLSKKYPKQVKSK